VKRKVQREKLESRVSGPHCGSAWGSGVVATASERLVCWLGGRDTHTARYQHMVSPVIELVCLHREP
jgi:hypothetical protein